MKKQVKQKNTGITLIALVITIIVLLILAGVTIATLTGDNGILTKATEASESTKRANAEEQVELAVTGSIGMDGNIDNGELKTNLDRIENITGVPDVITDQSYPLIVNVDGYDVTIKKDGGTVSGIWKPGNPDTETGIYTEPSTINGETASKNNPTIPAGFKPVDEGEATWGDGSTEPPGVDKGLVIEDTEGNQYVWIPVDGVLSKEGKTVQNAVDGEIILGRYVFDSNGNIDTTLTPTELGGELVRSSGDTYTYMETSSGKGNAAAKDIDGFIESVMSNGGYYIARFEASSNETTGKVDSKYDKKVWDYITQPNASIACQNLYTGINSDLMNSYAWDTAILFIQKYGQDDYSKQVGQSTTSRRNNTGKGLLQSTNAEDVQLNIYDMAGNYYEWTTETSGVSEHPCVSRGGEASIKYPVTSSRASQTTDYVTSVSGYSNYSFRPILYL